MKKTIKGGERESTQSESIDAEALTEANTTIRDKNAHAGSSGANLTEASSGQSHASAKTVPGMSENDEMKSHSVTSAKMKTDAEESRKNSTGKDSRNITPHRQEVAPSAQKSKKKRNKSKCGKSESATSVTETLASVEYVENKLDPSLQFKQSLLQRISAIESQAVEPKGVKYNLKYPVIKSPLQKEKKKTTSYAGDEKGEYSKGKFGFYTEYKTENDTAKPIKHGIAIAAGNTSKTVKSAANSQTSANSLRNKVKKWQKGKDNVKSASANHEEMESREKGVSNKSDNSTSMEKDTLVSLSKEMDDFAKFSSEPELFRSIQEDLRSFNIDCKSYEESVRRFFKDKK